MTTMRKALLGAVAAAGALAFCTVGVSAEVVCNGNVCWHAKEKYDYPATAGVIIHDDTWRPGPEVTIREHEGRGYWKGDAWTAW